MSMSFITVRIRTPQFMIEIERNLNFRAQFHLTCVGMLIVVMIFSLVGTWGKSGDSRNKTRPAKVVVVANSN